MEPGDVVKLAGGYANARIYEARLFKRIARQAEVGIPSLAPRQLATLAWAFAEVRHKGEDRMLVQIEVTARSRLDDFEPRDLVQLIRALRDLGRPDLVTGGIESKLTCPQTSNTTAVAGADSQKS